MNKNALVQEIVSEVLRQLRGKERTQSVAILAHRGSEAAEEVQKRLDGDADVSFLDDIHALDKSDRMILPLLSCSQMVDLAAGRASDPVMEKVLGRLLSGGVVDVFEFEYQRYRQTAPEGLFNLYESYEKILAGFSLKGFEAAEKVDVTLSKKLVTENDVIEVYKAGASVLRVPLSAILTPLAVDCAREHGVQIETVYR